MDDYKVKQLRQMLAHETGSGEHYGARLSHGSRDLPQVHNSAAPGGYDRPQQVRLSPEAIEVLDAHIKAGYGDHVPNWR